MRAVRSGFGLRVLAIAAFAALVAQARAEDWQREFVPELNATKTGVVYRLHGSPPNAHE